MWILTGDQLNFGDKTSDKKRLKDSFYIFDGVDLVQTIPYIEELDCKHLKGKGRPTYRPFGITTSDSLIYVATNEKIGVFDKDNFKYLGLLVDDGRINTHQIRYHNGFIYRADTSVDCVSKINVDSGETLSFDVENLLHIDSLVVPETYETNDFHHVNGININDGFVYVMLNNAKFDPSKILKFDLELNYKGVFLEIAGKFAHDIHFFNNSIYTLSTGTTSLIQFKDENIIEFPLDYDEEFVFLRGSFVKNDNIYMFGNNDLSDPSYTDIKLFEFNTKKFKFTNQTQVKGINLLCDITSL